MRSNEKYKYSIPNLNELLSEINIEINENKFPLEEHLKKK